MSRKPDAWLVDFDVNEIIREAAGFIDGELESIANRIADEARGEEFPTSKTGKLVKGIRPRVSKFENGGGDRAGPRAARPPCRVRPCDGEPRRDTT